MSTITTTPHSMHDSMLYDVLTEKGRAHIEELASAIWNEYNATDPGITILEVLSYVIADLSYRTSFEMKDIITGYQGEKITYRDLYLADQILPNANWTANDLRKVLLDKLAYQPAAGASKLELRNVFPTVSRRSEEALWFNAGTKQLQFESELIASLPVDVDHPEEEGHQKIILNGLYNLQLEFEPNPNEDRPWLQNLNENYFEHCFQHKGHNYCLRILMPYWDDVPAAFHLTDISQSTISIRNDRNNLIAVDKRNYDEYFYDYFAELAIKDQNGTEIPVDLNIHLLDYLKSTLDVNGQSYDIQVQYIDWHEVANRVDWDYAQTIAQSVPTNLHGTNYPVDVSAGADELVFDVALAWKLPETPSGKEEFMQARVTFLNLSAADISSLRSQLTLVNQSLVAAFTPQGGAQQGRLIQEYIALELVIQDEILSNGSAFYGNYFQKLQLLWDRVYGSLGKEHVNLFTYASRYRNVCEDYYNFSLARCQEIAVFGNVVLDKEYNPNKVLAEIYFAIDQFISPVTQFRTLSELKERGQSLADAFNGPLLENGFLVDDELPPLTNVDSIYTSDLVNFIMEIPGVIAIEGLNLSNYIDNRLMGRNVLNCLSLTNSELYRPKLSRSKSGLRVTIEDQPQALNQTVIDDWFDSFVNEKMAAQLPGEAYEPFTIPTGDDMRIEEYHSLQHDLPEVYGVGEVGLPLDATEERRAQARQLKGYLTFFDQLMANYLSQVSNLRELFSYSRRADRTYQNQPLYNLPMVEPLLKDFVDSGDTWDNFTADTNNAYRLLLDQISESSTTFADRRNRFLDHLIGRFAESFHKYASAQFQLIRHHLDVTASDPTTIANAMRDYQQAREAEAMKLIEDKICFLEEYPTLSNERGRAFNYLDSSFWDQAALTTPADPMETAVLTPVNVSGYKKRLCRLLGIKNYSHHTIFNANDANYDPDEEGFHVVEHILLRPRSQSEALLFINSENYYQSERDPYSFVLTIAIPDYKGRFQNEEYRRFVEETIRTETPAHIKIDLRWMDAKCGPQFELRFKSYLDALRKLMLDGSPFHRANSYGAYLRAHRNLINHLNGDCGREIFLQLNAQDAGGTTFIPDQNLHIIYQYGTTDIYFLECIPPGGELRFYELFSDGTETQLAQISNALQIHPLPNNKGFAEQYGQDGNYRIEYELNGQIRKLWVDVTKPVKVPVISLWFGKELIKKGDDCYQVNEQQLDGYFFQFDAPGGTARFYKEDAQGVQTLVHTELNAVRYFIYSLVQAGGGGKYVIRYSLDGQEVETCLQIDLIDIRVFHDQQGELFPDANNEIIINETSDVTLKVKFIPQGGQATRFVPDPAGGWQTDLVIGNAVQDGLQLTTSADYRYEYQYLGQSDDVTIRYRREHKVDVDLFLSIDGVYFPPNKGDQYLFDPFYDRDYFINFSPLGGIMQIDKIHGGQNFPIFSGVMNGPSVSERLFGDIWKWGGPGEYYVTYNVSGVSANLTWFFVEPMIRFWRNSNQQELPRQNNTLYFDADDVGQYWVSLGPQYGELEFIVDSGPNAGQAAPLTADTPPEAFEFEPSTLDPGTRYKMTYKYPDYGISDEVFIEIGSQPQPVNPDDVGSTAVEPAEPQEPSEPSPAEPADEAPIKSPPRPVEAATATSTFDEPVTTRTANLKTVTASRNDLFRIADVDRHNGAYRVQLITVADGPYRWEVDGKYRAQTIAPNLTLDFRRKRSYRVSLSVARDEQFAEITLTAADVKKYL